MSTDIRVVAIIQARIGSTRLPGKVLEALAGQPMLMHVVERARQAKTLDSVVVATTKLPADNAIVRLCEKRRWPYFRGSEEDVLDRYYRAALSFNADVVVRITSDCPLIEPEIIDKTVNILLAGLPELQYASNCLTRTYPRGLDVEAICFKALEKAWQEDSNPAWREHVTMYILRHPEKFKTRDITNDKDYSYLRWTVDTVEDLTFVRKIYRHFRNDNFNWQEVLQLLEMHPEWLKINHNIQQKVIQ
jgi:spore coat polysaccharide biosynthesis protein SpsF